MPFCQAFAPTRLYQHRNSARAIQSNWEVPLSPAIRPSGPDDHAVGQSFLDPPPRHQPSLRPFLSVCNSRLQRDNLLSAY